MNVLFSECQVGFISVLFIELDPDPWKSLTGMAMATQLGHISI